MFPRESPKFNRQFADVIQNICFAESLHSLESVVKSRPHKENAFVGIFFDVFYSIYRPMICNGILYGKLQHL